MDALALAGRGALVSVRATRPCAALVTFHASPGAVSDDGFMHAFDHECPGGVARATAKVADQFGVEP